MKLTEKIANEFISLNNDDKLSALGEFGEIIRLAIKGQTLAIDTYELFIAVNNDEHTLMINRDGITESYNDFMLNFLYSTMINNSDNPYRSHNPNS